MPEANLTDRQQKRFATIRAGLERDTGKTMDEWVAIARPCPKEGHRARLKWLKARVLLSSPAEVDAEITALLRAAWERAG